MDSIGVDSFEMIYEGTLLLLLGSATRVSCNLGAERRHFVRRGPTWRKDNTGNECKAVQ